MTNRPTRFFIPVMALLAASNIEAASLDVEITAIDKPEGFIMLAMFDSAEAFDEGGKPVRAVKLPVDSETVEARFDDLAAGKYAIKLYHDANGNGEMDSNMLGLPVEGYGFSNNAGRFGQPPFVDAAFEVVEDADNATTIRVR
ncbi:MAG: DUF2141 domain-containing protein [Pseudomonadota bacterium]